MIAQRRDTNEPEIIARLQEMGYAVIQMDRLTGFDLLAIRRGRIRIIEVKNPLLRWKYTDNELRVRAIIEAAGGNYETIFYPGEL